MVVQIVPLKLRFSCRSKNLEREACADDAQTAKAITSHSSKLEDVIWYFQFSVHDNSISFILFFMFVFSWSILVIDIAIQKSGNKRKREFKLSFNMFYASKNGEYEGFLSTLITKISVSLFSAQIVIHIEI